MGRERESVQLNPDFHAGKISGLTPLITRINFLKGLTLAKLYEKLSENTFLMPGAKELCEFAQAQNFITILVSGNMLPILNYYQKLLHVDYIIGSKPHIKNDTIIGISEADFPGLSFKKIELERLLNKLDISRDQSISIGDSPSDKQMFELVGTSIAINPKGGVEKDANFVIKESLLPAIKIIKIELAKHNQIIGRI